MITIANSQIRAKPSNKLTPSWARGVLAFLTQRRSTSPITRCKIHPPAPMSQPVTGAPEASAGAVAITTRITSR
jgi:hypothetical protein